MMTTKDVEERLQAIDKGFSVVDNPNNEMAGVYYQNVFAGISLPKQGIYEDKNPGYGVEIGNGFVPHKGWNQIRERAEGLLTKLENPEFRLDFFAVD